MLGERFKLYIFYLFKNRKREMSPEKSSDIYIELWTNYRLTFRQQRKAFLLLHKEYIPAFFCTRTQEVFHLSREVG